MKIMFLIRSLNYGGAERQLVVLAKGLHQIGHHVLVTVFYPNGPLETELRENGIQIKILDKRDRWDVFGFLYRLKKLIKSERPDILHGYLGVPNILTILMKMVHRNMKVVWGIRSSNMDLKQYDWLARISYRIECFLSKFPDKIIVNSNAGFDYAAANGFPKKKMIVIQNGIDTNRYFFDPISRKMFREALGIKENEVLIGLIGRIDPMKDHLTFLRAASLFLKEQKNAKFICVGDGPSDYFQKLLVNGEKLNLTESIIWAGKRDDMNAVYNGIDILTSTSISEGFSNVIGEAMACGVPCVVTNVGDSAKIVGDLGRVVPPNNHIAIVDEWKELLSIYKPNDENMFLKIRQRIIDNFSEGTLIKKTSDVLVKLLSDRAAAG